MIRFPSLLAAAVGVLAPMVPAAAQSVASSYATRDGRAATVVIACPNQDGSYTAGACATGSTTKPAPVTYSAPTASAITTANTAVTVFAAGSVPTGCDFVNTGSAVLFLDFTTVAQAGSATSIPVQPGQSYHCPFPPAGAVSAVAAQAQSFVAVRY